MNTDKEKPEELDDDELELTEEEEKELQRKIEEMRKRDPFIYD